MGWTTHRVLITAWTPQVNVAGHTGLVGDVSFWPSGAENTACHGQKPSAERLCSCSDGELGMGLGWCVGQSENLS